MLYSTKFNSISCYEFHEPKGRHKKKTILIFLVRPVMTLQLPVWLSTKIIKSNNVVSTHPIWKLKIVPEIYWSREYMVRNPFLDFECFTSINPCDSSTSPRANFWPMSPEKFLRHGFSIFHLYLPFSLKSQLRWHFGCLI